MLESQKIELRRSEVRQRLAAINALAGDDYTDDIRAEESALQTEYGTLEQRHRSAVIAEDEDLETRRADAGDVDAEQRERVELRSKASLSAYLLNATRGRLPDGAEAELCAAAGVSPGSIPIELWDVPQPERRATETRAVTPAPDTVGVNLDPIRPAVFASSVVSRLGVDMPRVPSGTFATATVTTSQSAAALAKGTDATAAEGALTVGTATPKRVSARLELAIEDIAAVGQANFESILRQNLSLALAAELDDQALNGNGTAPNLSGFFQALDDPDAPAAGVVDFDGFIAAFTGGIDGLWASTVADIGIVAGVETYKLSAGTFRDAAGQDLGDVSFADYAMAKYGGWWTNARMPAKATHIQQAILYRKGRSMMGGSAGMRTAVCPHWGEVSIDDIYSGAASGTRSFTLHVLLGDVLLVQPNAYAQVAFRVSV